MLFFYQSQSVQSAGLERIASGLEFPLFLTHAPGVENRLYVLEKNSGLVKVIDPLKKMVSDTPYLAVDEISNAGEQGLLGMAFHPNYQANKEIYISVTNEGGDSELRRYRGSSDPNIAASDLYTVIITIPQFASNHNGGWIGFGPDGYLYYAIGDGGSGNDPQNNGQDTTTLLGSILRLDIDNDYFAGDEAKNYAVPPSNPFAEIGPNGETRPEIWAYGLRNPWRLSFDRSNGDLWIADVGQNAREEVNYQPQSSSGGENYGWRLREGSIPSPGVGGERPADNVDPIYDYGRGTNEFEGQSVTGGYVYRGPVKEFRGSYIFGDFVNPQIWSLNVSSGSLRSLTNLTPKLVADTGSLNNLASFGEDGRGNLFLVDYDGDVFKIVGEEGISITTTPAILMLLDDDES
jgi:glucose/arabinose dehydrogenase